MESDPEDVCYVHCVWNSMREVPIGWRYTRPRIYYSIGHLEGQSTSGLRIWSQFVWSEKSDHIIVAFS